MEKEPTSESLFEQTRLAQAQARLEAEKSKQDIEFSRYKQDCRKRAMELAQSKIPFVVKEGDWVPSHEQVMELAEKYYQWLITIPQ